MSGVAQAQRRPPQGVSAETRICAGHTRSGARCSAQPTPGARYCYNHDPDRAAERQRNASRAGKSRGPGHRARDLDRLLATLYEDVLAGKVERGVGAVLTQIVSARIRLVETERRIAEVEAFEERVAELEAIVAQQKQLGGRRSW
jgi:hypothetical protein